MNVPRLLRAAPLLGLLLAGSSLLPASRALATVGWQVAPPVNTARYSFQPAAGPCPTPSTHTCLYAVGGYNGVAGSYNEEYSAEFLDPRASTPAWQTLTHGMNTPRLQHGVAAAPCPSPVPGTCIYAIGGLDSGLSVLGSVEYYNPASGTAGPWVTTPQSLNTARNELQAVAAPCPGFTRLCLYAIGGDDVSGGPTTSVEYYDPSTGATGSWLPLSHGLNTARDRFGAAASACPSAPTHTCIYAMGGDDNSFSPLSSVEYYDTASAANSWVTMSHGLTGQRAGAGGVAATCPGTTGPCVYILDGQNGVGTALQSVEYYAPSSGVSGTWQTTAPSTQYAHVFSGGAVAPCPTPSADCLYVISGQDATGSPSGNVEYYAPHAITTRAALSAAHVHRSGATLTVSWTLARSTGVAGFRVTIGGHNLSAHLIPVHSSPLYEAVFHTNATGTVRVLVVMRNGTVRSTAVH